MKTIKVNIRKPLYGAFVYVDARLVEKAIREKALLEIAIPQGRGIVDPIEWKKTGKIMKKVFKFPENPMILYGNSVPLPSVKGEVVVSLEVKDRQQKLL